MTYINVNYAIEIIQIHFRSLYYCFIIIYLLFFIVHYDH